MNEESGFDLFGSAWRGSVQIGAAGAGAAVTIGAMGEGARGYVSTADSAADRRLQGQLAELIEELRGSLGGGGSRGRHRLEAGFEADPDLLRGSG